MRTARLEQLRQRLEARTQRARQAWQQAQAEAARRGARVEELTALAREYAAGLARAGASEAPFAQLHDYRRFIDQLDTLTVQARAALTRAQGLCAQRQGLWHAALRREQAITRLLARYATRTAHQVRRRDARAEDEWTAARRPQLPVD